MKTLNKFKSDHSYVMSDAELLCCSGDATISPVDLLVDDCNHSKVVENPEYYMVTFGGGYKGKLDGGFINRDCLLKVMLTSTNQVKFSSMFFHGQLNVVMFPKGYCM